MTRPDGLVVLCIVSVGLALSSCRSDTEPDQPGILSVGGEVRDATGALVSNTLVAAACPVGAEAMRTRTILNGAYGLSLSVPASLMHGAGTPVECEFAAPEVATGPITKRVTLHFYPPGVPHPRGMVDLP